MATSDALLKVHQLVLQHLRKHQYDEALLAVCTALKECPGGEVDVQLQAILEELNALRSNPYKEGADAGTGSDDGEGEEEDSSSGDDDASSGESGSDDDDSEDEEADDGSEDDAADTTAAEAAGDAAPPALASPAPQAAGQEIASSGIITAAAPTAAGPTAAGADAGEAGEQQQGPAAGGVLLDPGSYSMSRTARAQLRKQIADGIKRMREGKLIKAVVARDPLLLA